MYRVIYTSNNSGGHWWLEDEDWIALADAGWSVHWAKDSERRGYSFDKCLEKTKTPDKEDTVRWLGALARSAAKEFSTLEEAIEEFERVTGQRASDQGCNCCGVPHEFEYRNEETGEKGYGNSYVAETKFSWS